MSNMPLHLANDPHFDESEEDEDYDETEVRVRFELSTNRVGSKCETVIDTGYSRSDWDEMGINEQNEAMKEAFWDNVMSQLGDWDWKEES